MPTYDSMLGLKKMSTKTEEIYPEKSSDAYWK
jgi:hypothetical protein